MWDILMDICIKRNSFIRAEGVIPALSRHRFASGLLIVRRAFTRALIPRMCRNRCNIVSAYLKLYSVTIGSRLKTLSVKYSYSHKPKKEPETLYTFVFPAP